MMFDSKLVVLLFSGLVSLAAGTPYLYGVYSPQLIQRCGLTASDSATLSFATSVGTSLASLPVGMFIDRSGPRKAVFMGMLLSVFGFFTLYMSFILKLANVPLLFFAMFCTGAGSIMPYYSTLKVATANFPHHRGTAGAVPVSAYGLSALFYSSIAAYFFKDNTAGLLRFISVFCGTLIGTGSFFVRIINSDKSGSDDEGDEEDASETTVVARHAHHGDPENSPLTGLLAGHRGSFANINITREDSQSSLFSYAQSMASSSVSINSSFNTKDNQQPQPQPIMTTTNAYSQTFQPGSASSQGLVIKARQSPQFSLSTSPGGMRISGSPQAGRLSSSVSSSLSSSPVTQTESSSSPAKQIHRGGSFVYRNVPPRGSQGMMQRMNLIRSGSESAVDEQAAILPPQDKVVNYKTIHSDSSGSEVGQPPTPRRTRKKKQTAGQHIAKLLKNNVFVSNCLIMMGLSAVGQVYIYSIGFIVKAQVQDSATTGAAQALQVSIISFSSFLGRLHSGPCSDLIRKKFKMQRLWVIVLALTVMTAGQSMLIFIDTPATLSFSSLLIGIAYGAAFGTYPSIMADQFGTKGFSTTWGLAGTGPIFAFFLLTKIFGHVYDSNSVSGEDGLKVCLRGRFCYNDVFKLTTLICGFLYIGIFALIKHNYNKGKH